MDLRRIAREIVEQKGWKQVSDTSAIEAEIAKVLDANPGQLEQYRAGKQKLFGFFVGQVMKATRGRRIPAGQPAPPKMLDS